MRMPTNQGDRRAAMVSTFLQRQDGVTVTGVTIACDQYHLPAVLYRQAGSDIDLRSDSSNNGVYVPTFL
jgi:hypothetical protein